MVAQAFNPSTKSRGRQIEKKTQKNKKPKQKQKKKNPMIIDHYFPC